LPDGEPVRLEPVVALEVLDGDFEALADEHQLVAFYDHIGGAKCVVLTPGMVARSLVARLGDAQGEAC
jgi:hypothetical protein